jgi:hypothetical protein
MEMYESTLEAMNSSIATRQRSSSMVFSCILDVLRMLNIRKQIPRRFEEADRI